MPAFLNVADTPPPPSLWVLHKFETLIELSISERPQPVDCSSSSIPQQYYLSPHSIAIRICELRSPDPHQGERFSPARMLLIKDSKGRSVVPSIVNGQPLPIDESRLEAVHSAVKGETCHYFQNADISTCKQACEAAGSAFKRWKRAPINQRREVLTKLVEVMKRRRTEISEAMNVETSMEEPMLTINIDTVIDCVNITNAALSEIRGMIPPHNNPESTTFVFKEPIGPVLVIPPWNAPILLGMRAVASVVATGCTVVLKASESCPLSHLLMVDMLKEAGVPDGVVNFVTGSREDAPAITEALIADKNIRKIEFIGSDAVGKSICATAAKYMKTVVTELGGKNAHIVLDDADLDKAAGMAAVCSLIHHGQMCLSTDRIIVQKKIADEFIPKLVESFKNFPINNAASERFATHAYDLLKDAENKGAEFLLGEPSYNSKIQTKAALIKIDPIADPESMRIIDEETFGPSAAVYIVDTEEEAIELANRSKYGLSYALYTNDLARGLRVGRELESGQILLNGPAFEHNNNAPFSSTKGSGSGVTGGVWHLENFYVNRTITWV